MKSAGLMRLVRWAEVTFVGGVCPLGGTAVPQKLQNLSLKTPDDLRTQGNPLTKQETGVLV